MKAPNAAFAGRSWRVHEFTKDFESEDVRLGRVEDGPAGCHGQRAVPVRAIGRRWRTPPGTRSGAASEPRTASEGLRP